MRYLLQMIVMASDIIIIGAVAFLWRGLGKEMPLLCLVFTVLAFKAWRETGGFIAWHPPCIRAFMRNAKEIGL